MGQMKELAIDIGENPKGLWDVEYLKSNGTNGQMIITANGEEHAWYKARLKHEVVFDIDEVDRNPLVALYWIIYRRCSAVYWNRKCPNFTRNH